MSHYSQNLSKISALLKLLFCGQQDEMLKSLRPLMLQTPDGICQNFLALSQRLEASMAFFFKSILVHTKQNHRRELKEGEAPLLGQTWGYHVEHGH